MGQKLQKIKSMEVNDRNNMNIYAKYWHTGMVFEIADLMQEKKQKPMSELEEGETGEYYYVFSVASCNLCKRLWNDVQNTTVWFEIQDTRVCPILRRVQVIN